MHIRRARPADAPEQSSVAFEAYALDPLTVWLYPNMSTCPLSVKYRQTIKYKGRLITPCVCTVLMVSDAQDADWDGTERILGCAIYTRVGGGVDVVRKWSEGENWARKLDRYLLSWEAWYYDYFVDCATNWANVKHFEKAVKDFPHHGVMNNFWYLTGMAVLPNARRRGMINMKESPRARNLGCPLNHTSGIATKLLEWGMETAATEGVPVTLESSPLGFEVYKKLGFRSFESKTVDQAGTGHAMLWEPAGLEGKWLETDEEGNTRMKGASKSKA